MKKDAIHKALLLLKQIPKGKVATYGELARAAGTSPRGAASVLAHNKEPGMFPCYKVVSADGELRGYSAPGGLPKKQALLTADGIGFTEKGRVRKQYFHIFH